MIDLKEVTQTACDLLFAMVMTGVSDDRGRIRTMKYDSAGHNRNTVDHCYIVSWHAGMGCMPAYFFGDGHCSSALEPFSNDPQSGVIEAENPESCG